MSNMDVYQALRRPPETALKAIRGGRLSGMTDINPQWRYEALTEQFGPCGVGWRYEIVRLWTEATGGETIMAFAQVYLYVKVGDEWSAPIPGVGGNQLVAVEKSGPHPNDEAYKMCITDALGTAAKMLGLAADIYAGLWDGSKYAEPDAPVCELRKTDIALIKKAREAATLTQADVVAILKESPFFCENPPHDLLRIHVGKLVMAIEEMGKAKA